MLPMERQLVALNVIPFFIHINRTFKHSLKRNKLYCIIFQWVLETIVIEVQFSTSDVM